MKKFFLLTAIVAFAVMGATSCKKCYNCQYEYEYLGEKVTTTFPEECGKKADVDAWKESKEAEAKRFGTTLTCQ